MEMLVQPDLCSETTMKEMMYASNLIGNAFVFVAFKGIDDIDSNLRTQVSLKLVTSFSKYS